VGPRTDLDMVTITVRLNKRGKLKNKDNFGLLQSDVTIAKTLADINYTKFTLFLATWFLSVL
jgi:hypothetical protein